MLQISIEMAQIGPASENVVRLCFVFIVIALGSLESSTQPYDDSWSTPLLPHRTRKASQPPTSDSQMPLASSSSPLSQAASQTTLKRKFQSLIQAGKTDPDFAAWAVSHIKSVYREEYPDLLPLTQPHASPSRRQRVRTSSRSPEEEEEEEESDTGQMIVHSRPKQRLDHYLALKVTSSP
jgi:hypothetical protein